MPGPLDGIAVVEFAGLGPGPFAATLLSDLGARVLRIDRVTDVGGASDGAGAPHLDLLRRNRQSVAIDLKDPEGRQLALDLAASADVLIEGFRPGVMERLGLGPSECLDRNPKLIYGRMTGWGQTGRYASRPGHDINYIAVAGLLAHVGRAEGPPVQPLNLMEFAGGSMFLVVGILSALLDVGRRGAGQVIDAAMIDGAAALMTMHWSHGTLEGGLGSNLLDSGAHFYNVYRCADGQFVAVGAIEPEYYAELLRVTGLSDDQQFHRQHDRALWPVLTDRLAGVFRTKSQAEWCALGDRAEAACISPVLSIRAAAENEHNVQRGTFVHAFGRTQPAIAPRFSRTIPEFRSPPAQPGQHTREALSAWGIDETRIEKLLARGAIVQRSLIPPME